MGLCRNKTKPHLFDAYCYISNTTKNFAPNKVILITKEEYEAWKKANPTTKPTEVDEATESTAEKSEKEILDEELGNKDVVEDKGKQAKENPYSTSNDQTKPSTSPNEEGSSAVRSNPNNSSSQNPPFGSSSSNSFNVPFMKIKWSQLQILKQDSDDHILGSTRFGTVYLAEYSSKKVAVKKLKFNFDASASKQFEETVTGLR